MIPCAERARFLKTGGEAVAACIKLARYHTGRDHVVQIGYNGWLNSLASRARIDPRSSTVSTPPGVPAALSALHHAVNWNDLETLEKLFSGIGKQVAALVVAADYATMKEGTTFYPFLRELANKYGTVLVFDEIVTGFRIALGGVQEYFGVTPDLAVFAKGIANGMPLSVYCGKAEIMDKLDRATVSSTYGGEALSLAAAKATLSTYQTEHVIDHIWQKAESAWSGFNRLFTHYGIPGKLVGLPPCIAIVFDERAPGDLPERFYRSAYRHGISLYNIPYVTFSHQDVDIAETLKRLELAIREI